MELIAVVMRGQTSASRNEDAKALLNYGFSTCTLLEIQPEQPLPVVPVVLGAADSVATALPEEGRTLLLEKTQTGQLTQMLQLPESVEAPVEAGTPLGTLCVQREGETLLEIPVVAGASVPRLTWGQTATELLRMLIFCA